MSYDFISWLNKGVACYYGHQAFCIAKTMTNNKDWSLKTLYFTRKKFHCNNYFQLNNGRFAFPKGVSHYLWKNIFGKEKLNLPKHNDKNGKISIDKSYLGSRRTLLALQKVQESFSINKSARQPKSVPLFYTASNKRFPYRENSPSVIEKI